MKKVIFVALFCLVASLSAVNAQSLWTSAEAKYKINKKFGVFAEGEFRSTDELKATARWNLSTGADYRIFKSLKVSAGYVYIRQREATEITKKGNIIPAYWQPKHRGFFDLTGSYNWNRFTFSLRERYQYTYRVGQSVPKFDDDGVTRKKDEVISSKSKHILRSRVGIDYNIRKSRFTPYATCEFYNSLSDGFGIDKIRYTVGTDYRFNKHNTVSLYYRYISQDDSDDVRGNVIGAGYQFKF